MENRPLYNDNRGAEGLLLFIYQRRVPLFITTILALIASVIVSLVITPRYSSSVILYPVDYTAASSTVGRSSFRQFGREQDVERMLQILKSGVVRDRIVEKYDLFNHYGISEDSRYPRTRVNNRYNRNVSFRKTQYMSVEISVLDENPEVAAAMAGSIAGFADSVMNNLFRESALKTLEIARAEYTRVKREVDSISGLLTKIREAGIIDYESQSEVYNKAYAEALLAGDGAAVRLFREKLGILAEFGGTYVGLRTMLEQEFEKLSELRSIYQEAKIDAENLPDHNFIVDKAVVAEKKAWPKRSLIVIVSTVSTFLLTLFIMLFADALRRTIPGRIS